MKKTALALIIPGCALLGGCRDIQVEMPSESIEATVVAGALQTKADASTRRIPVSFGEGMEFTLFETVAPIGDGPVADIRTKGTIITTANLGSADGFETFGMDAYTPDRTETCSFSGATVRKSANRWLVRDGEDLPKAWIEDENYRFWSYAPVSVFDGAFDIDGCSLDYSNPTDISAQQDLLVACTEMNSEDGKTPVTITFQHAMAAVMFKLELDSEYTFKGISINGAAAEGTLGVTASSGAPVIGWDVDETSAAQFAQAFDQSEDFTSGVQKTDGSKVFFMIPQDSEDISMTISLSYHGTDFTKTVEDIEVDWEAGLCYVYTLAADGANGIEVNEDFDPEAGTKENVSVTNTRFGIDYVRVMITGAWLDSSNNYVAAWDYDPENPESSGFEGLATGTSGDWAYNENDFCYYYKKGLLPGATTSDLFTKFTAPTTAPLAGAHLEIVIQAQAIDGKDAAAAAWGVSFLSSETDND